MPERIESISPAPRSRRRWKRILNGFAIGVVSIAVLLAGAAWFGTRSWFIIRMVQPELERSLGGELTIASAGYNGDGVFDLQGVELRAPGFEGPAGELLRVDRLVATVDLGSILTGQIQLRDVDVHGLFVRGSESARDPGQFSFMTLKPQWSGDDDGPMLPPQVTIHDAVLELGEHLGNDYQMVGRRRLTGKLVPSRDSDDWFEIELQEIDASDQPLVNEGLAVRGRWNVKTMEHSAQIQGVALDLRTRGMCPRLVKFWWDQLGLEGRVTVARMHWAPGSTLTAEMQIQDVALTLPIDAEDVWARYRDGQAEPSTGRPRMRVSEGVIRLQDDRLVLENLRGTVVSSHTDPALADVPYRVSLEIFDAPPIDWDHKQQWMEAVLEEAAFRLNLSLENFRVSAEEHQAHREVELPMQIARGLEKFQMTSWSLSSDVTVSRDPIPGGAAGADQRQPILTQGRATIHNATGRYFKFPYLLEDVTAEIEFDNDELRVIQLVGRGGTGSPVHIDGRIWPPAKDAAVSLRIRTENAPLDDRLRAALSDEGSGKAFDALFDEVAFAARAAAGVIPTEQTIQQLAERRELLKSQLAAEIDPGADANEQLLIRAAATAELERLDRMIELGPFQLRGKIDLDLRVERPYGRHQRTILTGTIGVHEVGVMHESFPYPLYVHSGTLDWTEDKVQIVSDDINPGLRVSTPGGGTGYVTGSVAFAREAGRRRVRPSLVFDIGDDRPTDSLFAAIPAFGSPEGEGVDDQGNQFTMSRVGELLRSLGLNARLDCRGEIAPNSDGDTKFDFQVQISQGVAAPGQIVEHAIERTGLYWPDGFVLRDVEGTVRVSSDEIVMSDITGRHDDGTVALDGRVDLRQKPSDANVHVAFTNLALQRHLLNLVPMQGLERIQSLWDRYVPQGHFDVDLTWTGDGLRTRGVELDVEPRNVSVQIGDERVQMALVDGSLGLGSSRVRFEDLKLALQGQTRAEGTVILNGSYGVSENGDDLRVDGVWSGARLDSPIIPEALRLVGADEHAQQFAALEPAGRFDAQFSYESASAGGTPNPIRSDLGTPARGTRYEFNVHPRTIDVTVGGQRFEAKLAEGSMITLLPGLAVLHDVRGNHAEGAFNVSGTIRTDPRTEGDLLLTHQGPVGPCFLAALPRGVRKAVEAIDLQTDGWLRLSDARIQFAQVADSRGPEDRQWTASFDGVVQSQGATIDAGLDFTKIDGEFDIHAARLDDGRSQMHIAASIDRMLVNNRLMTDGRGEIVLADDEQAIELRGLEAQSYDGMVSAQGHVGVQDGAPWSVRVEMANVVLEDFSIGSADQADDAAKAEARGDGRLYGRLSLGGLLGEPDSRRGFGTIRIREGRMANMPIALRLVQLLALSLPLSGSLNFADVEFFVEGDQARFERFFLEGPTISFHVAAGTLNIDTMYLDAFFRPRGTLPVMSQLVGGISDQLMMIHVTGPLADPTARMVAPSASDSARSAAQRMSRGE